MNTLKIFCKGNRRNRGDQAVSICGHIVKQGEHYEEDAYSVASEGSSMHLELMALMNALLDQEAAERLNKETCLALYLSNATIYSVLKGEAPEEMKTGKLKAYWEEIKNLMAQCQAVEVYCTDKKYRNEEDEEVTACMAHLNKIVCQQANLA